MKTLLFLSVLLSSTAFAEVSTCKHQGKILSSDKFLQYGEQLPTDRLRTKCPMSVVIMNSKNTQGYAYSLYRMQKDECDYKGPGENIITCE